jgi:hypothetical protein
MRSLQSGSVMYRFIRAAIECIADPGLAQRSASTRFPVLATKAPCLGARSVHVTT